MATVLAVGGLVCMLTPATQAAPSLVQTRSTNATAATSVSTAFSPAATAGDLLVVVCALNGAATITGPSGYSTAIAETSDPAQGIFYKPAAGGEGSVSCNFSASGTAVIHIFEYSGMHGYTALDAVSPGGSTGTTSTAATGNVVTTHDSDLIVAAVISDASVAPGSWSNAFSSENSGSVGGKATNRVSYGSADFTATTAGTYSTTLGVGSGSTWRGQAAAFKALAANPSLNADLVDAAGSTVGSPTVTLSSISPSFICQTVTGSLGSSTQKIRVNNTTDNPAWSLALAATSGPSAVWAAPTSPPHSYSYNNSAGSGCTAGQLTTDASVGTLSAQSGCTAAGVSKGSSTSYVSGSVNSVVLLSATTPAQIDCYWELVGVSLSQKIPAGQLGGNYSLAMTLTLTAN